MRAPAHEPIDWEVATKDGKRLGKVHAQLWVEARALAVAKYGMEPGEVVLTARMSSPPKTSKKRKTP